MGNNQNYCFFIPLILQKPHHQISFAGVRKKPLGCNSAKKLTFFKKKSCSPRQKGSVSVSVEEKEMRVSQLLSHIYFSKPRIKPKSIFEISSRQLV